MCVRKIKVIKLNERPIRLETISDSKERTGILASSAILLSWNRAPSRTLHTP